MLFIAWALMSLCCAGVSAAPDFQTMKISELREFLSARGEACSDCVEKSQFVKRAISVQDVSPTVKEASQADLKQGLFDEINDLRTNMGLDPMANGGEVEDQIEAARSKAKAQRDSNTKKSEKTSASSKEKEAIKTAKPQEKKAKTASKSEKKEDNKKTKAGDNKAKKDTKKQGKNEEEESDSKKSAKAKEDKKKPEKKESKKETEKDKKKQPEKDKKPDSKTKTKEEAKKTSKSDMKAKKKGAEEKTKEEKPEANKDKTSKTTKTTTKDSKKPASKEKEKPKEKTQKESGTIGAVWRTRGVKACEGVLKEDANSALDLPDVCQTYGAAIFEVFEEFDKSMGGLSFLNSGTGGLLGGSKKGGLKATSLTQPFLSAGMKVVKTAAVAAIFEANKSTAKPESKPTLSTPKTCPEVMCSMYCEHGFIQDENGCDTCACREEGVGGKKDEHGCALGGGYTWCEPKAKCLRTWEEPCEASSDNQTVDEASPKKTTDAPAELSLAERIKEITRKETMTWLFEVAMKNPEKLRKQQDWEDLLKKGKFDNGGSSSSPPSWTPPRPAGKASEAESYFDSLFEEKEAPVEGAPKASDKPPTLFRKPYNKRDSRSHVLEPEELEGVLDLDTHIHDEI